MNHDLVPTDQIAECEALLAAQDPTLSELRSLVGPRSPLPELAEIFYTSGGCWNLALAVNERTGLPIEVYVRGDKPTHAYVVDGDYAIDARGRNELRLARLGASRTRTVTPSELGEMLESEFDNGAALVEVIRRPEWVAAAARAADIVLAS